MPKVKCSIASRLRALYKNHIFSTDGLVSYNFMYSKIIKNENLSVFFKCIMKSF